MKKKNKYLKKKYGAGPDGEAETDLVDEISDVVDDVQLFFV